MEEKTKMVVVGSAPEDKVKRSRDNGEKATDDYHYERFKKQFRRYWFRIKSGFEENKVTFMVEIHTPYPYFSHFNLYICK